MKYWVYKESRILGPFEKEAVSGLPGLDSTTLICAGDPDRGSWTPAGQVDGISPQAAGGFVGSIDGLPSETSFLDRLQLDTAGLVRGDEFPGTLAEEMFQDPAYKKTFSEITAAREADEAEMQRSREKILELTSKLEAVFRQVTELEIGHTDLIRRLADKDRELRSLAEAAQAAAEVAAAASARAALAPIEVPALPPVPEAAAIETQPPAYPDIPVLAPVVPPPAAAAPVEAAPAEPIVIEVISSEPPAPAAPEPPPAPKTFGKPKSFKVIPSIKTFKVAGAEGAVPPPLSEPVPEGAAIPVETEAESAPAPDVPAPPPPAAPAQADPAPAVAENSAPISPQIVIQSVPTPVPVPAPLIDASMPATMARSVTAPEASAAVEEKSAAAARFAKPEVPSTTSAQTKKAGRSNKGFLVAAGILVTLLMLVGGIFMLQPKDDLKQMTSLDDGKAPIGLASDDGAASPAPAPRPQAVAPTLAPEAPPPSGSAEHEAAIAAVKDFPLDHGRGSIGRWLQYSYTASPGAGSEEWNASSTSDNTILVEYRLVPGETGGKGALYLFEVDANGIVMGKNLDARQMLAGGPRAEPPKKKPAKKPATKKAPSKRAAPKPVASNEVPLMPLPDAGDLRPPAAEDREAAGHGL